MKRINLYAQKAILMIASIWVFSMIVILPVDATGSVIIDHTCTDIWQIPEPVIEQAKSTLHIAYGHTSHGSQLTSGMGNNNGVSFDQFMTQNGATPGLYLWNNGGVGGALDLHNYFTSGDLGNPDRTTWAQRTRDYLDNPSNSDVNVIIWSWCGQAATTIANIDIYLNLMEELIRDYPNVQFVFMTGHLNGTGPQGQLYLANEHIRNHCRENNRILYDFADIESYDPDGMVNYMELSADDACNYDSDGNGTRDSNWALNWQASHIEGTDWWPSGASHSQHLNGNLKGYAAWWLWATLAGWNHQVCIPAPSGLNAVLNPDLEQVSLSWVDNSADINETQFVIQRRENNNDWNNDYARVNADVTQYTDTQVTPGTYSYRVAAFLDGVETCISNTSNMVVVQNANSAPEAPDNLVSSIVNAGIALFWSDNSDNEEFFILERQIDNGSFVELVELPADTTSHQDDSVVSLHSYTYRVKARNNSGESMYSNETSEYLSEQTLSIVLKQGVDGYSGCADTYLDSGHPQTVYGNTLYKNIGGTPPVSMAIKFELPEQLLNKVIHDARLVIFCWSVSDYVDGRQFSLHELDESWDETTATWYSRQSGIDWSTPGGSYCIVPVSTVPIQPQLFYPEFDITDLVQKWSDQTVVNNGLILINDSRIITGIKGSEYSEYGRPMLEISYSSPSACALDTDGDSDIDGLDLADFAMNFTSGCLASFADQFGN